MNPFLLSRKAMLRLSPKRERMQRIALLALAGLLLWGCAGGPRFPKGVRLEEVEVPSEAGGMPNLFTDGEGLWLSWVEFVDDTTDALVWSRLHEGAWLPPQEVARGSNWFVNWADFPSLAVFADGRTMAAHWLQMRGEGTYDYDVHIALSHDGGRTWPVEFIPHRDSVAAEHGFVTLLPLPDNRVQAFWLDGRQAPKGGPMTVRTAAFDTEGRLTDEALLDDRTCDCCQTDAVRAAHGLVVAWRDRSEGEIRDIFTSRQTEDGWTDGRPVHADNWMIAGCPVNGPALAAQGDEVVIVWFTMADDEPKVQMAFSHDGGATWSAPLRLDEGHAMGRVDVVWTPEGHALASWLEQQPAEDPDAAPSGKIVARMVAAEGRMSPVWTLTPTDPSRRSGFPILERAGNDIFLAWTEVTDQGTRPRTARLGWE